MAIALRQTRLLTTTSFVAYAATLGPFFSDGLLVGETDGFAIDATDVSATPSYTGASYAGWVSVKDTGTPANNLSNVALDSSNLVQSGTSPKMVLWNSSPYVRWTPHNLAQYSQDLGNAQWDQNSSLPMTSLDSGVAPDGTTTADRKTWNQTGNQMKWESVGGHVIGQTYTYSIYAKSADGSNHTFDLWEASAIGKLAQIIATPTWQRFSGTFVATGSFLLLGVEFRQSSDATIDATGDVYLWGAQSNRGPIATPYLATTSTVPRIGIPQSYDTAAAKYGVLVEPAGTNLFLRSEEFGTTWSQDALTGITSNATTAPDDSTTADLIIPSATSATHGVYQTQTNTAAVHTMSVYAKAGGYNWIFLQYDSAGNAERTWFNISSGTVGTVWAGHTATITSIGNGWYRCADTFTAANASKIYAIEAANADNTPTFTGDTTSGVYYWGAQLELGSVATSYIPTLGSTVTRAKDNITTTASSFPLSDTVGTLVAWAKPLAASSPSQGQFGRLFYVGDPTVDNKQIGFHLEQYSGGPRLQDGAGTCDVVPGTNNGITAGTAFKVAGAWAANDVANVKDNGTAGTDSTFTAPTGMTRVGIGRPGGITSNYEGLFLIYQLRYLVRRATNTELGTFTT